MAVLKDLIVHGPSRFINTAQFEALKANRIGAEEGVFNKLIATNADIGTLDVDDLTAQNATVVELLDVKGDLHTNSWTNSNISSVGGSFYVAPTVSTTIAEGGTPMNIAIGGSAGARTFQVTGGAFVTDAVKTYNGTTTSTVTWSVGSHVMVTGNIRVEANGAKGVDYPLGTLNGYLASPVTTGGPSALVTNGFTIGEVNSPALETIISELGTSNLKSYEIKISMYEIGPKTSIKPVGIMMTSYGVDKSTYIDIYGGVNVKNSSGVTIPNVRIGYLGSLGALNAVNGETPTGWGIYTDNGYFNGVIVSNSGKIGGFTIGSTDLYNGTLGAANSVWMSTGTSGSANIGGSGSIANWAFTAGNTYGVTKSGALYATSGKIGGWTIGTNDLSTGTVGNQSGIKIANTDFSGNIAGASRSNLRLAIGSGFGVNRDGVLYATGAKIAGDVTVSKLTVDSGATISDTNGLISNSAIEVGGKNLLGNTENPTTPTGSNSAAEMTFRSIGRYNSPDSEFSLEDYDGYSNSIVITSTATGNRGVNWYTKPASIIAGETYTFSCRVKTSVAATVHTHTAWRNGSATASYVGWTSAGNLALTANTWTDYSYTFIPASDAQLTWEFMVALCFTGQTGGVTCHIAHAKLEHGNKATDWTPAPEDVDANIEDVAVDAAKSLASASESIHQRINDTDDEVATIKANLAKAAARTDLNAIDAFVRKYLGDNGYVKINNQGLVIAQGQFSVVITGDRMIFQENGNSVAYLTNQKLFITKAEVTQEMKIANFVWTNRDGRLTLMLAE